MVNFGMEQKNLDTLHLCEHYDITWMLDFTIRCNIISIYFHEEEGTSFTDMTLIVETTNI